MTTTEITTEKELRTEYRKYIFTTMGIKNIIFPDTTISLNDHLKNDIISIDDFSLLDSLTYYTIFGNLKRLKFKI